MIPEDKKSILKLYICKLLSLFQLCSEKLSDWLKDLRWIMIPEDKEISFEALQIKLL